MEKYSRRSSLDISDIFNGSIFDNCSIPDTRIRTGFNNACENFEESEEEKKERTRSHMVIYVSMFIWTTAMAIPMASVFPYLKLLENDPQLSKKKFGVVTAVLPLGTMIFSPILGFIANKLGSVRIVGYASFTVCLVANALYGSLPYCNELWTDSGYHLMIISKMLMGICLGYVTVTRSYLAASSTITERTKVLAIQSASRSFGSIVGSVLQIVIIITIVDDQLQYQATGYIPAILSILLLILISPIFFKEFGTSNNKKQTTNYSESEEQIKIPKPDYVGIIGLMFAIFSIFFVYVLAETTLTPIVQDQYGWCDDMAVIIVGLLLAIMGIMFMSIFMLSTNLAKRIDERKILLFLGFGLSLVGCFLFFPFVGDNLVYCEDTTESLSLANLVSTNMDFKHVSYAHNELVYYTEEENNNTKIFSYFCSNVTDCLGCPAEQEWCETTPQLPLPQFFIAFLIIASSIPFGLSMINTLVSKILGPNPQAVWMGLVASVASVAHIISPVVLSYVYSEYGTRYMSGVLMGIICISTIITLSLYSRLIPLRLETVVNNGNTKYSVKF